MPAYSGLKHSACKKCIFTMSGIAVAMFLVLSASYLSTGLSTPFHAQCQLQWTWTETNCSTVHERLLEQVKKWKGPENCKQGGEKCLYTLIANSDAEMDLQHTTPVKRYVDDISFKFCDGACGKVEFESKRPKRGVKMMTKLFSPNGKGCTISGFSKSKAWYAVFDYGTNYCNMRNLADGAKVSKLPDFVERTDDDFCTSYSTANCTKY